MPTEKTDLLIVGAGPTGLAAGAALARDGFTPLIVDQSPSPAHTSRAAVVHARTLELLDELGIAADLLAQGLKVPIFRIRDRDAVLLSVDFGALPSKFNYALMCPQDVTEQVLLSHLAAHGGTVERGWQAIGIKPGADAVLVELARGVDRRTVQATMVLGADGGHSFVRDASGIPFPGGSYQESFILADVHMTWPIERDEVSLFFSPQGLVVVLPLPGERYRIVATVEHASEQPDLGEVQAVLDARGPACARATIREIRWSSRFHVHHRLADRFREGRLFLAGDAAHVHSPAGGQGMNTGIQDAIDFARSYSIFRASGDAAQLDGYSERRRAVAKRIVAMTDRMTRAATVKGPLRQSVRNAVVSLLGHLLPVRQAIIENLAELHNA